MEAGKKTNWKKKKINRTEGRGTGTNQCRLIGHEALRRGAYRPAVVQQDSRLSSTDGCPQSSFSDNTDNIKTIMILTLLNETVSITEVITVITS
jgi:hypothetical protein